MIESVLESLGLRESNFGVRGARVFESSSAHTIDSINPATGQPLASVRMGSIEDYERIAAESAEVFRAWRTVPGPVRGEVVRQLGQALRDKKRDLGLLVTLETGKIRTEGEGEVQEMIDMCDFAVGLVAPALRPDDRQRAAPAPDDRAVASAGADRDHHGVQLPGRGLGLERRDRGGLRRHDDLEAFARGAA